MRQYTLRILIVMALLPVSMVAKAAYDFFIDGIYYNIISGEDRTVEVTYNYNSSGYASYRGNIVIPPKATSNGITYNVISIGYEAFRGCTGLTSIELPESLTEIGSYAFYDCTGLTSIELPEGLTKIGSYAFSGCTGLTSIEFLESLTESLTEIGSDAFHGCTSLTSIEFPESLTKIGSNAFRGCTGLTSIEFPESLTEIGGGAFRYCTGLTSIELPEGLTKIGYESFRDCTGLTSIELPESLTEIGGGAFWYCTGLTSIELPEGLTKIGNESFRGCTGLTSIELPESLTEIGFYAFHGCTGLTSIVLPQGVSDIARSFEGCENLAVIEVSADNQNFASIDGVLFTKDFSKLLIYPEGKKGKQYIVPEGVTTIGEYSFRNYPELVSIEFPESLMEIEDYAFENLRMSSVRCKSIAPPKAPKKTFNDYVLKDGTLYVPVGSKDEYMAVDPWRNFWTIEELDGLIVLVESVAITDRSVEMDKNETYQLSALIFPENATNKTLLWQSSDEDIATVDENGLVTSYGNSGTVEISATTCDGSDLTALCTVTVAIVLVESVAITDRSVEMDKNETYQLSALIFPENATYKTLLWQSSDEDIATVDENGLVTSYGNPGTVEISATTRDGSDLTASCTVTVAAKSGIGYIDAGDKIDVRAADGNIYIISKPKGEDCFVYNIGGTLVSVTKNDAIYGLEQGVYVVRIGAFIKKVVL